MACACGGGSAGSSTGPETSEPEIEPATEPPEAEAPPPADPAPVPAAPPNTSLPRTPDAAEAWRDEPEPEPGPEPEPRPVAEPAPERRMYGVNAETYRRLGSEDQQALREGYEPEPPEPEPAPPPEPEPVPAPEPEAVALEPEPAPVPPPAEPEPEPQVYGVDASLYRRLGSEDQQAIREDYEEEREASSSLPMSADAAERWLADREDAAVVPPAHAPTPPPDEPIGDGDGPLEFPEYYPSLPPHVQESIRQNLQEKEDEHQAAARQDMLELAANLPPEDAEAVRDYVYPDYVALGDSYSAGTGTNPQGDPECERSPYAYGPELSADRGYQLDFQACGGATIPDVLDEQIDAVEEDTAVVTISVGGNDANFGPVVKECAEPFFWGSDRCGDMVEDAQEFIRDELPAQLDDLYGEIRERAPDAEVVVVGYPRLFGDEDCNAGTSFGEGERDELNETADLLADVTRDAAQEHGFEFVDAIPAFTGHEVCGDPEYINGLSDPTNNSFHPNREGHDAYGELITVDLED